MQQTHAQSRGCARWSTEGNWTILENCLFSSWQWHYCNLVVIVHPCHYISIICVCICFLGLSVLASLIECPVKRCCHWQLKIMLTAGVGISFITGIASSLWRGAEWKNLDFCLFFKISPLSWFFPLFKSFPLFCLILVNVLLSECTLPLITGYATVPRQVFFFFFFVTSTCFRIVI